MGRTKVPFGEYFYFSRVLKQIQVLFQLFLGDIFGRQIVNVMFVMWGSSEVVMF